MAPPRAYPTRIKPLQGGGAISDWAKEIESSDKGRKKRTARENASPKAIEKVSRPNSKTRSNVFRHQDSQEIRDQIREIREEERVASVVRNVGEKPLIP